MNELQVSELLTIASMIDNRTVAVETVNEWHRVIGHLDFTDARAGVERHFMESTEYLMPAHIVKQVGRIRSERAALPVVDEDAGFRWPPAPDNFEAMCAAYRDPVAFAREVHIYDQQLVAAGFPTTEEDRRRRYGRDG